TALIGSGLPAAFLPAYSQLKHRRGDLRAERLAVQASACHFVTLLIGAALIYAFGPQIVDLLGHGFPAEKQALALRLMNGMTPFLLCFGLSLQLANWLRSNKLFAVASAAPLLIPVVILGALLATHHEAPIDVLVWSTNVGAVLHLLVLILVIRRRLPTSLRWWSHCFSRIEPANRIILRGAFPFIVSSIVLGGAPMVDQAMAANLSSGSVTVLGFSDKVCGIILALTASAAGEALFPFFADAVARREWTALKKQLVSTTGVILAAAVPMVALLCWQAPLVVKLLFERGEFTPEDTARVAEVLRYAALQIPFYISSLIMSRVVVSLQANWFTLVTAVISLVSNVGFN
ncbi:MAG: murein biosynthesis integral membrane protein MurJ, partial [Myxococcota bacterium]